MFSTLISFVFWTRFRKSIATCFIEKKSTLNSSILFNLVALKIRKLSKVKWKLYNTINAFIIVKYKHALHQGFSTFLWLRLSKLLFKNILSCLPNCDPITLNKSAKKNYNLTTILWYLISVYSIFYALTNVWWPLGRVLKVSRPPVTG